MIEIVDSSSTTSHVLGVGDELRIRFEENPTTGYRWQFRQTGTGQLNVIEDKFEAGGTPGASTAPGAAGYRVIRFVAHQAGDVRLEAVEGRQWNSASPAKTRVYSVTVR